MNVPSPPLSALEAVPAEGWRGCPLFSLDNLYRAWRRCRRGKRRTLNALAFEADLEAHLLALRDELVGGTWRPRPPLAFLVERPKRREVFAADFRDRIVHHVLVAHLEPGWERRFIHDSYACRVHKGTHAAVDRLRQFCRQATANGTRPAWTLQLDVKGFFINLDRRVLWARLETHEHDPAVRWLIQVILHHEPTEACRLRGHPRAVFTALPAHKTLFRARPGCGLPIGNLTSQFFANVYLDALDQFIKHQLKAHCYLRYCDDLVLVSADRAQLAAWEGRIAMFLAETLNLTLNARRRLQPVANGIDFLGYIVRPDYLLVRRRVVGALRDRLGQAERELQRVGGSNHPAPSGHPSLAKEGISGIPEWPFPSLSRRGGAERRGGSLTEGSRYPWPPTLLDRLDRQLQSYWAHLARARTHRLREALWRRYPWLEEYFARHNQRPVRRVPARLQAIRYREQIACFRRALPGHELRVQRGRCWDRFPLWHPAAPSPVAPRAWIVETGARLGPLRERRVAWTERQNDRHPAPRVGEGPGVGGEPAPHALLTDPSPTLENAP